MKRLLVVRHSNAENRLDSDQARALTDIGLRNAAALGKKIQAVVFQPELILVSPAKRTLATLEEITPFLNSDVANRQIVESLYQGHLYDVLKLIRSLDDALTNVMVVGHNPVLTELINCLGNTMVAHLNPSGAYLLEFVTTSWANIESIKANSILVNNPD